MWHKLPYWHTMWRKLPLPHAYSNQNIYREREREGERERERGVSNSMQYELDHGVKFDLCLIFYGFNLPLVLF